MNRQKGAKYSNSSWYIHQVNIWIFRIFDQNKLEKTSIFAFFSKFRTSKTAPPNTPRPWNPLKPP